MSVYSAIGELQNFSFLGSCFSTPFFLSFGSACPTSWCPRISLTQTCNQQLSTTDPTFAATITCSSTGLVTQIVLGSPVPGRFPIEILSTMTGLTSLQLFGDLSARTAAPPSLSSLASLTQLESLILSWHNFSGLALPASLSSLTKLTALTLSGSQISGTIPSALFASLSRIQLLDLSENRLAGTVPGLSKLLLTYLHLSENFLSGVLALPLGNISANNGGCVIVGQDFPGDSFSQETNCFQSCTGGCCQKFAGNLCPNPTPRPSSRPPASIFTPLPVVITTTTKMPNVVVQATTTTTTSTGKTTFQVPTRPPTTPSMDKPTVSTASVKINLTTVSTTSTFEVSSSSTEMTTTTVPSPSSTDATTTLPIVINQEQNESPPLDAIIGGVVGGAVALIMAGAMIAWCVIRQRRQRQSDNDGRANVHSMPLNEPSDSQRDMYSNDDVSPRVSNNNNDNIYSNALAPSNAY